MEWMNPLESSNPSIEESMMKAAVFVTQSKLNGCGLFSSQFISSGTAILVIYDDAPLTMAQYLYQVHECHRHPHEFLANKLHVQSKWLDHNNFGVLWYDLVRINSPVIYLNGANKERDVNVDIRAEKGWANRDVSILVAICDIQKGTELLDSYMI